MRCDEDIDIILVLCVYSLVYVLTHTCWLPFQETILSILSTVYVPGVHSFSLTWERVN